MKSSLSIQNRSALLMRAAVWFSAAVTMAALLFIILYILIKGIPHLTPELFAWTYTSDNVSLTPALINTLSMTALSLLFAVPAGIGAAVYLSEYARRGNRLVSVVRITAETLSGIPGQLSGGQLRPGRGTAADRVPHRPAQRRSRHSGRCHFGDRANRGRIRGPDLYRRHSRGSCHLSGGLRQNAVGTYVRAVLRGTAHRPNLCHRGGAAGAGHRDQRTFRPDRRKIRRRKQKWIKSPYKTWICFTEISRR